MKNGLQKIKDVIKKNKGLLRQSYKVKNIGIFGSYVKGYADRKSDVDVLVEFYETPDMFKFMELEFYLKKLLGKNVDLVTRKALKPLIKNDILKETVFV